MRRLAVSLLSGGLDSCVASLWAQREGYELYLLSFNYGQVMRRELAHAKRIAHILRPVEHRVLVMEGFREISRSSRTYAELIEYDRALDESASREIPAAYPPGRDTTFIFTASAWLESMMLEAVDEISSGIILIGTNRNDAEVFPDCRATSYDLLNRYLAISTKVAVQFGRAMRITTPLIERTKAEVVALGVELGAPLAETWSCYEGHALACGRCDPCRLRLWAFEANGLTDPVPYAAVPAS